MLHLWRFQPGRDRQPGHSARTTRVTANFDDNCRLPIHALAAYRHAWLATLALRQRRDREFRPDTRAQWRTDRMEIVQDLAIRPQHRSLVISDAALPAKAPDHR